ncbi:hypothetical protein FGO68_gene993 [Halteria grandinella]|uniref:Uncharacterized protein n=1 Tax=Halteria grandinella TaxID=5974 RepID=A0A8J8SUF1_HALGN|nr:hypothetical protein FGO68_gene993 [Halteria grandinella]
MRFPSSAVVGRIDFESIHSLPAKFRVTLRRIEDIVQGHPFQRANEIEIKRLSESLRKSMSQAGTIFRRCDRSVMSTHCPVFFRSIFGNVFSRFVCLRVTSAESSLAVFRSKPRTISTSLPVCWANPSAKGNSLGVAPVCVATSGSPGFCQVFRIDAAK